MESSTKEQNANISLTEIGGIYHLYTTNRMWINKMEKLCKESPGEFKRVEKNGQGCTYTFPKRLITIKIRSKGTSKNRALKRASRHNREEMEDILATAGTKFEAVLDIPTPPIE